MTDVQLRDRIQRTFGPGPVRLVAPDGTTIEGYLSVISVEPDGAWEVTFRLAAEPLPAARKDDGAP